MAGHHGIITVTEAAWLLGCSRPALSRVLNGRAAVSADMALAFEREGWSNADFWMRRQAAYDLAQARRRAVDERHGAGPPVDSDRDQHARTHREG